MSNRPKRVRRRHGQAIAMRDPWWWRRPLGMFLGFFVVMLVLRAWMFDGPSGWKDFFFALGFAVLMTACEEIFGKRGSSTA